MKVIINKNIPKSTFVIITIFTMILGFVVMYLSIRPLIETKILKTSEKTIARIYDSSRENTSKKTGHTNFQRVIKYTYVVDNVTYDSKSILWWRLYANSSKGVEIGKNIDVYYNINEPNNVEVYHNSYFLLFLSILFVTLPPIFLLKRFKS